MKTVRRYNFLPAFSGYSISLYVNHLESLLAKSYHPLYNWNRPKARSCGFSIILNSLICLIDLILRLTLTSNRMFSVSAGSSIPLNQVIDFIGRLYWLQQEIVQVVMIIATIYLVLIKHFKYSTFFNLHKTLGRHLPPPLYR